MTEGLEQGILIGMIATGIRLATPYLLAALGEMLSQRAGVFNLGLEGIMLMGAFAGFYITYVSQSPLLGLLAAIVTGGLMGLLMAFVSVTLQAEQGISGIGLSMLGWGLSGLFFRLYVDGIQSIAGLKAWKIPGLGDIPIVGPMFFNHHFIVYFAFLLVPFLWFVLFRTTWGLSVRAVGMTPQAVDPVPMKAMRVGAIDSGCAVKKCRSFSTDFEGRKLVCEKISLDDRFRPSRSPISSAVETSPPPL